MPATAFHVLVALAAQDLHGYAILRDVETRTGGEVRMGAGTLYRTLQRLLEQGFILELEERPAPEDDDERRRYYRITAAGRAAAIAESRRLARMLDLARAGGLAPEIA